MFLTSCVRKIDVRILTFLGLHGIMILKLSVFSAVISLWYSIDTSSLIPKRLRFLFCAPTITTNFPDFTKEIRKQRFRCNSDIFVWIREILPATDSVTSDSRSYALLTINHPRTRADMLSTPTREQNREL